MGKVVLNVALNHRTAKTIVRHLGGDVSDEQPPKEQDTIIYEFETVLKGEPWKMLMISVSGHLLEYQYTEQEYRRFNRNDLEPLFKETIEKAAKSNQQKQTKTTLETKIQECDALIIWSNESRDAENIASEVIEVCQAANSDNNIKIHRAIFRELTEKSVHQALANLMEPNKNISDAIEVRHELDFRTGCAFSRFAAGIIDKYIQRCRLSYGSCQIAPLAFVVNWYHQSLSSYLSQLTQAIKVTDDRDGILVEFRREETSPPELDECNDQTVKRVACKLKQKQRPLPLNIVELVENCSNRFGLSAKETTNIFRDLLNRGLINYRQTSPNERELKYLVDLQTKSEKWGSFAKELLGNVLSLEQRNEFLIYPTKYSDTLKGKEAQVYEFVVRRFLACLSKDAEFRETIVTVTVFGTPFTARGIDIIAKNYLEVYEEYEDFKNIEIHRYENGQTFSPVIEKTDAQILSWNPLTETKLFSLMVDHHIGTMFTHADHIETIKNRKYAFISKEYGILPTPLGLGMFTAFEKLSPDLTSLDHRTELEKDLAAIGKGVKSKEKVLEKHLNRYKDVMTDLLNHRKEWEEVFVSSYNSGVQDLGYMFHFNPSALAEYKSLFGHMTEPMALSVKDELNFQQEMESTE